VNNSRKKAKDIALTAYSLDFHVCLFVVQEELNRTNGTQVINYETAMMSFVTTFSFSHFLLLSFPNDFSEVSLLFVPSNLYRLS